MSLNGQLEIAKENQLILEEEKAKLEIERERQRAGSDLNLTNQKDGLKPMQLKGLKIETNKS